MKKKLLIEALDSNSLKRIFNDLIENEDFEVLGWISRKIQSVFTPFNDIYEEDGYFVIVADVAGYQKDDLEIEVIEGENKITVSGDREKELVDYIENGRTREFKKKIRLPQEVKGEGSAELKDGVLTIRLKKHEEETTQVDIE
ncbi:hypothetical protein C9439_00620 [archaeon SCG-AAA382B04]|nr:hypothetical protein C9439_00620 [archaeon SCG-AAA382B04]